jgi:hypothetical protein
MPNSKLAGHLLQAGKYLWNLIQRRHKNETASKDIDDCHGHCVGRFGFDCGVANAIWPADAKKGRLINI